MTDPREILLLAWLRARMASGEAKRMREMARLSIIEASNGAGVSASALHRWERGERQPHGAGAIRYAELLKALEQMAA